MKRRKLWWTIGALFLCAALLFFSVTAKERNALFVTRLHARELLLSRGVRISEALLASEVRIPAQIPLVWGEELAQRQAFFSLSGALRRLTPHEEAYSSENRTLVLFRDATLLYRRETLPAEVSAALSELLLSEVRVPKLQPLSGFQKPVFVLESRTMNDYFLCVCTQRIEGAFLPDARLFLVYREGVPVFATGRFFFSESAENSSRISLGALDFLLAEPFSGEVVSLEMFLTVRGRTLVPSALVTLQTGEQKRILLPG